MLPVLILILILILIVIPIHEDWGCALELPRWARKDGEERMELVYWTRQVGREGPGLPRAPIGSAPPYAVKSPTPQPPPPPAHFYCSACDAGSSPPAAAFPRLH